MALSRFVLTATVTITPDVAAAIVAGEASTQNIAGTEPTAGPGTAGKFGLWAAPLNGNGGGVFQQGQVIYADSSAGTTGPQLLYQAIGAANLRAYVQGQDDVGHAALAN